MTIFSEQLSPCNVFLTGVTGFVGRYLLYQLCEAEWIDEIYVLIRPKRGKSPDDRLQELLRDDLFTEARKKGVEFDKINLIAGDILEPRLGMSPEDIALLSTRVSLVIHNAAALSFAQAIKTGVEFNTKPAWNLYLMASREFELKPAFVLISSIATNSHLNLVPENITPFSGDALPLYNFIRSIPEDRATEKAEWLREGRLDNYGFSKALVERMIYEDVESNGGQVPVHMVRPGGIINACGGPLKRWMHETCFYGQLGCFVYKGQIPFFLAKRDNEINMAPVDLVGNLTMICCLEGLEKRKALNYSVQVVNGSSIQIRGITFNRIFKVTAARVEEAEEICRNAMQKMYKEDAEALATETRRGAPRQPFFLHTPWVFEVIFAVVIFFPMWLFHLYEGDTKRYTSIKKLTTFLYKYVKVLGPYLTREIDVEHGHCEYLQNKYGKMYPIDASNIDPDEFTFEFIAGVGAHIFPPMEIKEQRLRKKLKGNPQPTSKQQSSRAKAA